VLVTDLRELGIEEEIRTHLEGRHERFGRLRDNRCGI
jgi:hypothetical protein